jgi:acylphosphatase
MTVCFLVSGKVQGVGYRYFVSRVARELLLTGWARNLPDGAVEVMAQGARAAIDQLEADLRRGPLHSRVDSVVRTEVSDEVAQYKTFIIN